MFDSIYILKWFLTLLVGGFIFLPLSTVIFKDFKDKGYIFSKIIAIAFVSYAVFIISWLKLLPFSSIEVALVVGFFAFLNLYIAKKISFIKILKTNWKFFLFEEIIFFAGLLIWSFVRGNAPDINGLEKFMDFGFVNSILRSTYFPPTDMWYPPFAINYYYFGHLATAVIIKASAVPSNISYNLMLATLFSFTFSSVFSLGFNIFSLIKRGYRAILAGFLSAALVAIGGNLTTIYTFFQAYMPMDKPVPFWTLPFQPLSFPNGYWYPNATRFIPFTIHEFPIYSFVVSDLHGHVLDIPFVILTLGLLLSVFIKFKNFTSWKNELPILIFIGFMLAIMYMTNAWDGLIYFLMFFIMIAVLLNKRKDFLKNIILRSSIPLAAFFAFTLPFSIHFKPFVSGIGVICAPKFLTDIGKIGPFLFEADHCQRSPVWQLVILYGFFYFFVIAFIIFLKKRKKIELSDKFVSILIILSTLLLIVPEFIYVKDIYPMHYRANTMFKLAYEAFILLGISCGFIIFRILDGLKLKRNVILFFIPTFILVYMVLSYSIFAINSYYSELKGYKGLNGTSYLNTLYPDDFKIINWFNKNVKNQPVVLEANGDSYTNYARISANTGLPTVIGWPVHEWLWRGTYDIVAPRIDDVKSLYESNDLQETKSLLKKYQIKYVVVSQLEKEKYPDLNQAKFNSLGRVVYRSGKANVYLITL